MLVVVGVHEEGMGNGKMKRMNERRETQKRRCSPL